MFNTRLFAERLHELIFDNNTNPVAAAKVLKVPKSTIYRYLNAERIPGMEMLIKLADFLHCSISFLIGTDNENYAGSFQSCPLFKDRFKFLLDKSGITKYKLAKETKIPESVIFSWLGGQSQPNIESIIKLSVYFKYSIDFVIGREN